MYALNTPPVPGAQWTGIVTQIAIEMLESGQVEAVVCVQSDESDRFTPRPVGGDCFSSCWAFQPISVCLPKSMLPQMVARCKEDILKARGVKPTLSPNLDTLATVEALDVKRLLFIGVGCQVLLLAQQLSEAPSRGHALTLAPVRVQVQALRAVEPHLNLEALYVLGTNCVDNGPRQGLDKFLRAASATPDTVLHYEFMQVRCWSRPASVPGPVESETCFCWAGLPGAHQAHGRQL